METYTFKIKVSKQKVVAAVHMSLEQFYDSMKLTNFDGLLKEYPFAYVTASDYFSKHDKKKDRLFVRYDYGFSSLKSLSESKDLRSFLLSPDFFNFYGDEYNRSAAETLIENADKFMCEVEKEEKDD